MRAFKPIHLPTGDTNENVIGNTAIGHGSNTTTLGNSKHHGYLPGWDGPWYELYRHSS